MSRRRRDSGEDDGLLDLPLEPPSGAKPVAARSEDREVPGSGYLEEPENLSLFDAQRGDESGPFEPIGDHDLEDDAFEGAYEPPDQDPDPSERGVTFLDRVIAGGADLVLLTGVLAVMLVAMVFLGATPRFAHWPGLAGFLISFSFLYVTLPLAFWGQTPGMAWARLQARDTDDRPLAFSQTVGRWIAGLVTVLAAGVPALLGLTGRSLGDLLSGSRTHRIESDRGSA